MANFRQQSRAEWINSAGGLDREVELGCLQRIADGIETMGKNVVALEADRNWWKTTAHERWERIERYKHRIAGLKGTITRLKAKEK